MLRARVPNICVSARDLLDATPASGSRAQKGGSRVFVPLSRVFGKTEVVLALLGAFVPLSGSDQENFPLS